MKKFLLACLLATKLAPGFSQNASKEVQPLIRTQSSFDLVVHASYPATATLFGPEGERAWAGKHWNPQFIHPLPPHDEEDAVFTIQHGDTRATWVAALHDVPGRHFKYVYFIDGLLVTTIDVRFTIVGSASTTVQVVYTRTALTPAGIIHVAQLTSGDRTAGPEWQRSINAYLASRSAAPPH
jgi:hypothetical protein